MIDLNRAERGVDDPQRRRTEKRPFETWTEIGAVAAKAGRYGPLVVFAAATGMRPASGWRPSKQSSRRTHTPSCRRGYSSWKDSV